MKATASELIASYYPSRFLAANLEQIAASVDNFDSASTKAGRDAARACVRDAFRRQMLPVKGAEFEAAVSWVLA